MSLLFYGLFHKSDKSETRFLRPAPTEHRHKGWRCLHIWLLRGSNKNKKDQPAEFIIDHPELMSIRFAACLPLCCRRPDIVAGLVTSTPYRPSKTATNFCEYQKLA
jgi:hypothetical protein